jgi:hypothetical protein
MVKTLLRERKDEFDRCNDWSMIEKWGLNAEVVVRRSKLDQFLLCPRAVIAKGTKTQLWREIKIQTVCKKDYVNMVAYKLCVEHTASCWTQNSV